MAHIMSVCLFRIVDSSPDFLRKPSPASALRSRPSIALQMALMPPNPWLFG